MGLWSFRCIADSADKVLRIVDHEHRAQRISGETLLEEAARKEADWTASAADRLPFLPSATSHPQPKGIGAV